MGEMVETRDRIRGLDGIRALAIILVLLSHAVPMNMQAGGAGVDIFFALSGWLITGVLLAQRDRPKNRLKVFYLNRLVRLYPALLTAAIGFFVIAQAIWTFNPPLGLVPISALGETIASVTYTYPFYTIFGPKMVWGQMWTLSVEWYFYLLFPVILFTAVKKNKTVQLAKWLLLTWFVTSVLVVVLGVMGQQLFGLASLLRVGAVALGCWARLAPKSELITRFTSAWGSSITLLLFAAAIGISWFVPALSSLAYFIGGLVGVVLIHNVLDSHTNLSQRFLNSRFMVWVGGISYEIYLWHLPLLIIASAHPVLHQEPLKVLSAYGLTLILSQLTNRLWAGTQAKMRAKIKEGLTSAPTSE